MRAVDIIIKKRNGFRLTDEEISFFVDGFTRGEIPDYQAAAWAMAVFFKGMEPAETVALTMAMVLPVSLAQTADPAPAKRRPPEQQAYPTLEEAATALLGLGIADAKAGNVLLSAIVRSTAKGAEILARSPAVAAPRRHSQEARL